MAIFALAQLTYGFTFRLLEGFHAPKDPVVIVPFITSMLFLIFMYKYLGRMRIPVAIYALLISFMVCGAISTLFDHGFSPLRSALLVAGASLFYVSDIILAVDKFRRPFRLSRLANLATYYGGQLLIALATSYG